MEIPVTKRESTGLDFSGTISRAKQSFKKEADINNIMGQYTKTGVLPQGQRQPTYGDFTNVTEFRDVVDRIKVANDDFSKLDAETRAKFGNKPEFLIAFLSDPANAQEAIEMGLIPGEKAQEKPAEPEPAEQPKEPVE